jgi:hypothetical protein
MSAEIILFVPRANPSRKEPPAFDSNHYHLDRSDLVKVEDTAPCEYVAPDGDCA